MQKIKFYDFSNVHVYIVEFVRADCITEFHQVFATSISHARQRAYILKKFLFGDYIPLSKIRTVVYRRKY